MNTRLKIRLVTLADIKRFVDIICNIDGEHMLENSPRTYRISAKSFLGTVAAVEDWDDIWVASNNSNIYSSIKEFVQ